MHIHWPASDSIVASDGGGIGEVRNIELIRSIRTPQYSGESLVTVGTIDSPRSGPLRVFSVTWACAARVSAARKSATGSNFMDSTGLNRILMRRPYHTWCDIWVVSG